MIKKLLLTVFLVLVQTLVFGATNTYTGANGDWNTATNWSLGTVPTATDDVIIPSGISVNISANSFAKSISLSGNLTINDLIRLTVYSDFTVIFGGSFIMPGGSALSTLVVYGDYVNYGTTDFWKSTVVIAGDLLSSATSELQKQGNVVVGGNIIGDFDLTGGTGTGQIYAVNPNATVTITPTSIDNNVTPGIQVVNPPETTTLVDLVNEVIYGGSCPFSITNPTSVSACSGSTKTFSVVASGSLFAYAYQWQVNDGSGWVNLTNVAPYSNVTTSTLTITGTTTTLNSYQYRIKITSNSCTKNSNYGTLSVSNSVPSSPGVITGLTTQCATNANNEVYSVVAVPSATKYNWVFPAGWTITSGSNTNVVTVTTSSAVNGNISVTAENGCGVSSATTLAVTISSTAVPGTPTLSAVTGVTCAEFVVNWTSTTNATSYILDVSTDNGNGANSFDNKRLTTYNNLNIGNVTSYNVILLNPNTTYYYRITAVNSCKTTQSTIQSTITSSSTLGTPLPSISGAATVCASNSGLVYSINAVTNATNYFWTVPSGWTVTGGQGTTSVIVTSGTTGGNVIVSVGNDCITSVNIIKVVSVGLVINTWSGSAWSTGSPPPTVNGTQIIVFNTPFISSTDLSGCSCQANADVLIKYGHTLTLINELKVANGINMVFDDTASLVQKNDVMNIGNIEYNRMTKSRNSDYTYWSSPVLSLQPLGGLTGLFPDSLNGTFYSFDSSINPADWKNESSGTAMTVGKGYIARGPEDLLGTQTPPNTPFTTTFNGVPNNGTINVPILHSGAVDGTSNLIGNPYPSAIDANAFLSVNSTVIEGTIYFWTHNTAIGVGTIELGSGLYPYTGNDYASYNGTGGAAGSGGKVPTGKIGVGQGFFVTSLLANGNAKFENTMRIAGNNSQFFKTRNPKTEKVIEKNRLWLNLTNTQGAFKQTLVGYVTDATNDYDSRFDGESFDGNEFVDFYSVNQDKNLVIQGRALPFDENDEVPLGYRTTINGDFTINIDQVDGLLTNQAVFIEDKLTNTVTDLKSGNYTFNTVAGTFNDRFVLRYTNTNKTLATKNFDSLENKVLVSNKNKQIKINSFAETIYKVTIYDLLGRQIYQKDKVNSNELSITNLVSSRQTLIVKTVLQNGQEVSKKIIY